MNDKNLLRQRFTRKNMTPVQILPVPAITGVINILGVDCQVKEGLVNLTDLWKASGKSGDYNPMEWLRQIETIDFIQAFVKRCVGTAFYFPRPAAKRGNGPAIRVWAKAVREHCEKHKMMTSVKGRNGGTFAHWQIALAYAKWLSPEFHIHVNGLYRRVQVADPTLIESMIDRIENPEDLKRIGARARNRESNVDLNDTIIGCGGTGKTCAFVANNNNVAITGKTAKELREKHNLPEKASTRPYLDTDQMIEMAFLERLERKSLEKDCPKGHDAVLAICDRAIDTVKEALAKHI